MRNAISSISRSSRAKNHRLRFIARHLTFWLVLLILGAAVVLSSVLPSVRDETRPSAAGTMQKRGTRSVVDVLNEKGRIKLDGNGNPNVIGAYRKTLGAELFMNPPASKIGPMAATSFARLRATPSSVNGQAEPGGMQDGSLQSNEQTAQARGERSKVSKPKEERLTKADSFNGDLRDLPRHGPVKRERPERDGPEPNPTFHPGTSATTVTPPEPEAPSVAALNAPAPPPTMNFAGLDFANFGNAHPPDTVGDVGPTYYIQAINTSIGIFRKSDGVRVAAFSFNTFMSQGNFGNLCDTNNFGDPVILYDSFEDRWIITDFAFTLSGSNVVNPPGAFQCVAASMSGDPVAGGWNFYSINTPFGLGDYPKFGIWPDGVYMAVNIFGFPSGAPFQDARVFAFNKAQMYAGMPSVQVVSFDVLGGDFGLLPANARLQSGTPPPGTPNYFISSWLYLNALSVYKFHVDWNSISTSTLTGPAIPLSATSWPNAAVANAPSLGGNAAGLDVLQIRAMMQNQYSNVAGAEALWATHTVRRANTTGFAAPRWYQVDVTGGTINPNIPQATTWDPDAANVMHRFQPSLAVDRVGNMALGYSTSNSTTKPAIKYAGRLFSDPVNTFSQTEQVLVQGAGTQVGNCGPSPCARWGDYAAMSLDSDGCTFWLTHMYYDVDGLDHQTRIGSFGPFTGCTPVGNGTLSGTVTALSGGAPISGATLQLGTRTTTTDVSGNYSFSIPSGTYTSLNASKPGFNPASVSPVTVPDADTLTQNFTLATAPTSACLADSTQAELQTGIPTSVDLLATPGSAILTNGDPQNFLITTSGGGFTITTWAGQTFTPIATGDVTKIDMNLFCSGCTGTTPNLTVSIRATSGGFPTGADLGTATIPGFYNLGAASYFSAVFATPVTLTGGTMYAFVIRPVANPSPGTYAFTRSGADVYAGGTRVSGTGSGTTWSNPLTATQTTDAGFRVFMGRFLAAGNLVSSIKDANPAGGITAIWGTLSWNANTPANTAVTFQIAGSNSATGPFNFVGPDNTAATFFTTSPASLSQFYGLRYLRYKAFLSTTDNAVTPSLDDVTICFADVDCGTLPTITPTPAEVCSNSTGNTASGPAGMTAYAWGITNGTITSSTSAQSVTYTAGASGSVTLNLTVTTPSDCITANSALITINPIPPAPTITPDGPTTFCSGGSVTLTSSSASGNQWYLDGNPVGGATNQTYVATASGSYTDIVTASGCPSAASTATTVTVNPAPATPTITPGGPTTFCTGGSVTLTSSSASGNQWYLNNNPIGGATNQTYIANASGNYTDIVTASGCSSSPSAATTVTVNPTPATPTITPGGPTTFCTGGSVTLTSSSASGNQWYLNNNPIGGATNQAYIATAAGNYTDIVTTSGCASSPSAATTVTINPLPATPTITAGGSTTFCAGSGVMLTSSSVSGNQWYLNTNSIGGATNQAYSATAAGNYTVTVTTSGCTSPPSAATTVTADPPPVLTYGNQAVALTGALSINPATGPADNLTVSSIVVQSLGTYTGSISVDNTTGVVSVSNAAPAGAHTITVRITDSCGATTDASFTLNVSNRALISLSSATYSVNENTGFVTITINRSGDLSLPVTVDYENDDTGASNVCGTLNSGLASARCDFSLTLGTLKFAASETQKTFTIPITQDSFTEGPEMFAVNLSNLTGTAVAFASPSSATVTINDSAAPAPNANDDTETFVRQQYRDFLNREADAAGLAFWAGGIDNCTPKPECTDVKRVDTSAAFFLSIEFQNTGNLVRSFYVATLDRPLTNNMPAFVEFERDTQAMQRGLIVGQGNWEQILSDNREAFMADFVTRAEFVALYPTTDITTEYVDKLYLHAAVIPATPAERQAAIDEFGGSVTATDPGARGRALLRITQNVAFQNREINRSFVQMEYFGYLRRNPNDAPDGDFAGYDFWLNKLNAAGGNYVSAEMVKAFIVSLEYRRRFGP